MGAIVLSIVSAMEDKLCKYQCYDCPKRFRTTVGKITSPTINILVLPLSHNFICVLQS